jgi:hypothetical protein
MLKRLLLAVLLLCATMSAGAKDYTDVYFDVAEPGWGAFLVQSDTTQFLAFFIYDKNGNPTWYTAQLMDDGTGNYTGTLYAITGTYFANPWAGYTINPAGTASFQPSDNYHATLTYTVTGLPTVMKAIQRQTLSAFQMAGNYSGSMAGSIGGCAGPQDTTHSGIVCTVAGSLTHLGRLYQLVGTLACTGPGQDNTPRQVTIDSFHPTGQGIEGKVTGDAGGGCTETLRFAAVLNVNN